MTSLEQKHLDELLASAIDPQIITLNFKSLDGSITEDGTETAEYLLSENVGKKNGGMVTSRHSHYQSLGDGWWCNGIDLITGDAMTWGCFKANEPRLDKDGKPLKYEHPPAEPTQYFALRVTFAIGAKIAQRYDLSEAYSQQQGEYSQDDEDKGFWQWATGQKVIPLLITEGAKKTACLLSHGYLSIAISGIWNACESGKDTLKPGIAVAAVGREVVIVFDSDSKEKTKKAVNGAAVKLSDACKVAGSTTVTQVKWQENQGKGVDDLIVSKKVEMFDHHMEDREEVKELHPATPKKEKPEKRESLFISSIEKGLILLDLGDDGNPKHDADGNVLGRKVGNHLETVAYIDSPEQDSAALLLEFGTARGSKRRWTMPRSELAGDGSEICRGLLSRGYWFDRPLKRHLLEYLQGLGSDVEKTYTVTESSGWVGKSFVLPHKTYGDENLKFRDVELSPESLTEVVGTLQEWIDRVAAMCAGNSRLILALGASFAAPLMPLINIELEDST
jgi:putative DNA primase/helicase